MGKNLEVKVKVRS